MLKNPILSTAILHKKAKATDLLSTVPPGFTPRLLVSYKLKCLIEDFQVDTVDFFKNSVLHKDETLNYWLVNPYKLRPDTVNFKESKVVIRRSNGKGGTELADIETLEDFKRLETEKARLDIIYIDKLKLITDVDLDIFVLNYVGGGTGWYVSERFKNEAEKLNITGVEFSPINLNLNE